MGMAFMRAPADVHQNCFSVKRGLVSESKGNGLSGHFAQRDAKTGGIPQQSETPNSDSPGLLLLDDLLRPLYVNDEAVLILCFPQTSCGNGQVANFLKPRIEFNLPKPSSSPQPTLLPR